MPTIATPTPLKRRYSMFGQAGTQRQSSVLDPFLDGLIERLKEAKENKAEWAISDRTSDEKTRNLQKLDDLSKNDVLLGLVRTDQEPGTPEEFELSGWSRGDMHDDYLVFRVFGSPDHSNRMKQILCGLSLPPPIAKNEKKEIRYWWLDLTSY